MACVTRVSRAAKGVRTEQTLEGVRSANDLAASRVSSVLGLDPSLTHTAGYHVGGLCHGGKNPEITSDSDICATVAQNAGGFTHGAENPSATQLFRPFAIATKPKDHAHPLLRLRAIRDAFVRELETCEASARAADDASPRGVSDAFRVGSSDATGLLFTEGYAFGARNGREALGELGGMLRLVAFERGWTVVWCRPARSSST